jgi:hypothetical protein
LAKIWGRNEENSKTSKKTLKFSSQNLKIMPDFHEIHFGGQKHYQQQDLS